MQALISRLGRLGDRSSRAERLLEEAHKASATGRLDRGAQNICDALATDPEHAKAEALRDEILARLEARRRDQKLREGITQIKSLMAQQNFSGAIEAGLQIQDEFPESSDVRLLIERARKEQLQKPVEPSIDYTPILIKQFPESLSYYMKKKYRKNGGNS